MTEALSVDAPPAPESAADVPPAAPQKKPREAWKTRKRISARKGTKGRGNGVPIPPPADEKTTKAVIAQLEREAMKAIATGKDVIHAKDAKLLYENMTATTRAHIMALLGPDIEDARRLYADELMANSRKVALHMMDHFAEFPPSVQAFLFTSFVDKSEMLRAKNASTAHGAKVQMQVNVFGDGTVDRNKLIAQLTGEAFQAELPAEATPAV